MGPSTQTAFFRPPLKSALTKRNGLRKLPNTSSSWARGFQARTLWLVAQAKKWLSFSPICIFISKRLRETRAALRSRRRDWRQLLERYLHCWILRFTFPLSNAAAQSGNLKERYVLEEKTRINKCVYILPKSTAQQRESSSTLFLSSSSFDAHKSLGCDRPPPRLFLNSVASF